MVTIEVTEIEYVNRIYNFPNRKGKKWRNTHMIQKKTNMVKKQSKKRKEAWKGKIKKKI